MRISRNAQKPLPIIGGRIAPGYPSDMTTNTDLMPRRRAPCRKGWSPEERLAYHTKADPLSGCLIWQGALNSDGYGRAYFQGRDYRAHRWAWIIKHGRIPDDMVVCHRCDERRCVNTDHLFLDTHDANMSDMTAKWRHRRTLGIGGYKRQGGLPPNAQPAEIAPIRIVLERFELVGDVVLRPLYPDVKPITPSPAPPAGRAPGARSRRCAARRGRPRRTASPARRGR